MQKFSFLQFRNGWTWVALAAFFVSVLCQAQQPTSKVQPRPPRPAPAARVTRATLAAVVPPGKPCPITVELNGTITTTGPLEVKYTWVSSDNANWPEHTINFAKAGTEKVHETWQLGKTYTGWVQLKVVTPNQVLSPRANFKVNCGPAAGTGKVTRATLAAVVSRGAACPLNVSFNGTITTNGPAEVKYTWVSFDGGSWPERTLKFGKAGTEKVGELRHAGESGKGWMQLKIVSPNAVMSPRANYVVTCPAAKPQPAKPR